MIRRWIILSLLVLGINLLPAQAEVIAPNVFLRGLEFSQNTRYTATFIRPTSNFLMRSLSVEITLPPDTVFNEMLVSEQVDFKVIRVGRAGELTLIWQISRVEAADPLDAFAFTVAQPLSAEVEFYMEWLDEAGQKFVQNFREVPPVTVATDSEGAIFPVPEAGLQPVGETGVQLASNSQESVLGVRLLPNDFNPPAEYGDIWWCSLLEVTGLGAGQTAEVLVPLRRPVAPFTELALFQQQADGSWLALPEVGLVTADGQFVQYTHLGGLIASGGDESIQIELVPVDTIPVETPAEASDPQWEEVVSQNNPVSDGGLSDQLGAPVENQIQDGTSNTVLLEEQPVTTPNAVDGNGNTVFLGEQVATPFNTVDGNGNTVFLGEQVATPSNDGNSNTVFLGEQVATPFNTADGNGTTVFFGDGSVQQLSDEVNTDFLGGEAVLEEGSVPPVVDGNSNTVFLGEEPNNPTPADTLSGDLTTNAEGNITLNDGSTIFLGEDVATNPDTSDGTSNTITIVIDDVEGVGVLVIVTPDGEIQCQLGSLICVQVNRQAGTR